MAVSVKLEFGIWNLEFNKSIMQFALIGAAGFIAPRHMKAIKDTGNDLVAAVDPNDCVGILDSYFPGTNFFVETERFDRHLDKLRRKGENKVDYVSICSPNYLHDAHIRLALRNEAHAICEKPLVLNPWNVDALKEIEQETDKKINVILQLRYHPTILELKRKVEEGPKDKIYDVDLTYITSRGKWYFISWKGDIEKSGGVATNIGIHFFDMLSLIFGKTKESLVHHSDRNTAAGFLHLERARVRWFMSLDYNTLPEEVRKPISGLTVLYLSKGRKWNSAADLTNCIRKAIKGYWPGKDSGLMMPGTASTLCSISAMPHPSAKKANTTHFLVNCNSLCFSVFPLCNSV
jgi:UDP-N-acetyl-2-amino-2-deoxyglucuronate dehydrogenase